MSGERRGSYYDNYANNMGVGCDEDEGVDYYRAESDKYDKLRNELLGYERAKSPTQTISLLTTVPQNITASNIAGKHAPTRQSLRHSRMIVMNKTGQVPTKSTPPILRFHKLAKALVALQVLVGMGICFVAFWVFIWTPTIKIRDNPFWSGTPLVLSGIVGLFLLFCCRKEYPGEKNTSCVYGVKIISILFSSAAGTACLIAAAFALIHILSQLYMTCVPVIEMNNTCLCEINNSTISLPLLYKKYHYVDLQCPELTSLFILLLIFSCGANFIGAVLALWYVYLHWASRYVYIYSKVHSDSLSPTIISNGS